MAEDERKNAANNGTGTLKNGSVYIRMLGGSYLVFLAFNMFSGRADIPQNQRIPAYVIMAAFLAAGLFFIIHTCIILIRQDRQKMAEQAAGNDAAPAEGQPAAEPSGEEEGPADGPQETSKYDE